MTLSPPPPIDLEEIAAQRRRAAILAWGIVLIAIAGLGTLATLTRV